MQVSRCGAFSRQRRHCTSPPLSLPGAFFSSVSEEKKQKKTAYYTNHITKKDYRIPAVPS